MDLTREILDELKKPFPEVKWRAGATTKDKTKALALAYIESRDVMDRLDEVVGGNWEFRCHPEGIWGALTVCGVTREDVGDAGEGEFATRKSAASDALKRCAVHFGIGRYLYRFPAQWLPFDGRKFTQPPQVPKIIGDVRWTGNNEQRGMVHAKLRFAKKAAEYYKLAVEQIGEVIGNVEWTDSEEQRKAVHGKLKRYKEE